MSADRTLRALIASGRDDAVAIAAHGAPPLSYAALRALIDRARGSLNDLGIGRGDRVAIVLPNGPEMATAFLCVASAATSAPLNPAYKQDEFAFYTWDERTAEVRWMCSWDTTESDVDAFAAAIRRQVSQLETAPRN